MKLYNKIIEAAGKIRRVYLIRFRKQYVSRQVQLRQGECMRCGACCRFVFDCPFLQMQSDGKAFCRIHTHRHINCRFFPINKRDLADRDLCDKQTKCGYNF